MKRTLLPLAIFAIYIGMVGVGAGAERHSVLARQLDQILVAINLFVVAFLSALVVRERWQLSRGGRPHATLLRRIRAWFTDDRASG